MHVARTCGSGVGLGLTMALFEEISGCKSGVEQFLIVPRSAAEDLYSIRLMQHSYGFVLIFLFFGSS